MKKTKKAFTLIELLVVITIIGILVTLVVINMGSAIDKTQRTKVTKALDAYYTALKQKSKPIPSANKLSEKSPAGYAAWAWDELKFQEVGFWLISVASDVEDLQDDDASGMPEFIGDGDGDVDTDLQADQKKAISWEMAIPQQGASGNLVSVETKMKGRFPIMWTKGLQNDGTWEGESPWAGAGGHILFSDGTKKFYENTLGDDEKGLFRDENQKRTKDITQAIPSDWEILKPE